MPRTRQSDSTIKRSRALLIAALFAIFALVAAACGDDSDDSTTEPETTEPETTEPETTEPETTEPETTDPETTEPPADDQTGAAAGTTVKIGLLYSETGRSASAYLTSDEVASAWAEYANANKNGANGHVVEVIARDVESDVAVAAEKARELVEQEGVVGVIIQDTNTETGVREYLAEQGVPVIGGTSNAWAADIPATEFTMASGPPGTYIAGMASAAAAGASHFSSIACTEVPTCATSGPYYDAYAGDLGLEVTSQVLAAHTEASYTAFCLSAIGDGADTLSIGMAPVVVPLILGECQLQGFDGFLQGGAGTVTGESWDAIDGLKAVGYLNGFPWWADEPAVEEFRTATADVGVDVRNTASTTTWAALELFRKAMIDNGPAGDAEVAVADVTAAFFAIEGETLGGLLPQPLTFSEGQSPAAVPCSWLMSYEDGVFATTTLGDSGNGATGDLASYCPDESLLADP